MRVEWLASRGRFGGVLVLAQALYIPVLLKNNRFELVRSGDGTTHQK